ncbi:uncharacterized protein LOC116294173 [Actinia tenebrosa]|uniref:Uncharacterized protein LOC116294173 n=1 Tax=Actinia tenebrosa TaxID=6105 RepID=A0A6P8HY94_ACTTE|nr:uncharacterized protein LOC116294173 [Actinia tenebrosa]
MQTSESASVAERKKGNRIFENAKKWGLSFAMRKILLENAMACYVRAEDLASNNLDEYSSASKNHGKAAWKLFGLLKEKQEEQDNTVLYLKEAAKFFCVSYENGSRKHDEWRNDLLISLNNCVKELHDICQNVNEVDEKCRILSSFIKVITVKDFHVELQINHTEILFHDALKFLQNKDYKGALKRLKECYRPIEEAKMVNQSESCAAEIRILEQDVYFHTCSAESIQACECGNEVLNIATLNEESLNMNLVWDAVDWYKRAAILTRELDLEQEAIALSHLGFVYNKVLKDKDKSKEYYKKCFELAESMKPRTFFTQDWYQQCVSTLQEFQKEEWLKDERIDEEAREVRIVKIKKELEDLKENNTGECEILIHVYNTYPPKNSKWVKPSEKDMAKWAKMKKKDFKKVLLKGIYDYHPDKIDAEEHCEKWKTLCEEITKLLTAHYDYLKMSNEEEQEQEERRCYVM